MLVIVLTTAMKPSLVSKLRFPVTKVIVDFSTRVCRERSACCQQLSPSQCCWISHLAPSKALLPLRSVPDLSPLD